MNKAVLVIDSDTETAQKIVTVLESEDYLVFAAPSGDFGITMAMKVNPALIFLNPSLAGMSGLEVCKQIHGTESLEDVPIVVLSSLGGPIDPRYTSLYGIVDSLKKPFSDEELISKTKEVLSMRYLEAQPAAAPEESYEISEEAFGSGEGEEGTAEKESAADSVEEEGIPGGKEAETEGWMEEEKAETGEPPREEEFPEPRERARFPKKPLRRRGRRDRFLLPVAIAVVILIAAGFALYSKGLLPWKEVRNTAAVKPMPPRQQVVEAPSQEQLPQPKADEGKPAVAPPPVEPFPPPQPEAKKPEVKPAGRAEYHLQIGAFKDKKNAETLTKRYADKGYDVFIRESIPQGKEMFYRVLIGNFENMREATRSAEKIASKEDIKVIIFRD